MPPLERPSTSQGKRNCGGHETFAAAARTGLLFDKRNKVRASIGNGSLTHRAHRQGSNPGDYVKTGPMTARDPRAFAQDRARCDDVEMRALCKLCEQMGLKAAQKFKTTRDALRFLDADHDGLIERSELRHFFRAYDFGNEVADRFFDYFDDERRGFIAYSDFVEMTIPYFNGVFSTRGSSCKSKTDGCDSESSTRTGTPTAFSEEDTRSQVHAEFGDALRHIARKMPETFGTLRRAIRHADGGNRGSVCKSEMRYFFRAFNLPEDVADRFQSCLAGLANTTDVNSHDLFDCLSPYIEPQYREAALPRRSSRGPSEVTSPARCTSKVTSVATREQPEGVALDGVPLAREKAHRELKLLLSEIGAKLPVKFRHPRDAFRMLDLERNGWITRSEMQGFFRGFGYLDDVANRIFDLLRDPEREEVDFKAFMKHFDGVLGPAFRQARRDPLIPCEDRHLESEVNKIAAAILDRLITKYRNVHDAFRALDLNRDGTINQAEMRNFIRGFGMPVTSADKIFSALDKDGSGEVKYDEFIAIFPNDSIDGKKETKEFVKMPHMRRLF
jgi:Ca2+-binding EF-hand superfamily protein